MANHASAKKRYRQNTKRRAANRSGRTLVASAVKKVQQLVESGDKEGARKQLQVATRLLDKAAVHGLVHKNNARRRVARLAQRVNKEEGRA